ncbi:hypothetical protein HN358_04680 [Candidatus Uhrbacteria bacterium]|jgi:hypothetical protein|nr:hypothetical protein [Candidatus Uhrbacteria bacterium]MBT7717078.1 hypothetical protein [Candidatus Uhrbacteria bacterium]
MSIRTLTTRFISGVHTALLVGLALVAVVCLLLSFSSAVDVVGVQDITWDKYGAMYSAFAVVICFIATIVLEGASWAIGLSIKPSLIALIKGAVRNTTHNVGR